MQLQFKLNMTNDAWYPTLDLNEIKSTSGSAVDIKEKLVIVFSAPGKITAGDINVETNPWKPLGIKVESTDVGGGIFDVKVIVEPTDGQPVGDAIQKIHMGLNVSSADSPAWSDFRETFALAADEEPGVTGELSVSCPPLPAGLKNTAVELRLVRGDKTLRVLPGFGHVSTFSVNAGNYTVIATDLSTDDGTIRVPVNIGQAEITIDKGRTTSLAITFGAVDRSTTIDVALNFSGLAGLRDEELTLICSENGTDKLSLPVRSGQQYRLEHLPVSGRFEIRLADLRLNNVHYLFDDYDGQFDGQYHSINYTQAQVSQRGDSQSNAAKLTVSVKADAAVSKSLTLRLTDNSVPPRQYRFDAIAAQNGNIEQAVLVAPGSYTVVSDTFILDGVVHYVDVSPQPLLVSANAPAQLNVAVVKGANLRVKGFPEFLTFGACANMVPTNVDDFAAARVSSIFKYSGDDGMGDAGDYLSPSKEPTLQIIKMARDVSAKLNEPVLPLMVSYTCNLSLGDVTNIIADPVRHKFSFANFIQSLQMSQSQKDAEHPVPAGYIVNPDYLGECQKYGFLPTYEIPVRQPLSEALAHHNVNVQVPAGITNTLKGYIRAVNWLTRVVAPDVVLGWQVNLWGVAGSQWVYKDFVYDDVFDAADLQHKKMTVDPFTAGRLTAQYALLVGVFDDIEYIRADGSPDVAKGADFMAADRYEADDFTIRSYANGYCYSPYEWERTFDFCASLSRHLRQPVLPWQVPASHLPTSADDVNADFNTQNWGSGGSYLMGHSEIGTSADAIHERLLALKFDAAYASMMGNDTRELFSRHSWDLSTPKYLDFPSRGIFHVHLGGGATTGVISGVGDASSWMRNKLKAYRDNPVKFEESSALKSGSQWRAKTPTVK